MLLDKFRGSVDENELRDTLITIYKSMFGFPKFEEADEESEVLDEIKNELIDEELQWCLEEYEKSQMDNVDWSLLEQDHVICPVCQKKNFKYEDGTVSCPNCNVNIKTQSTLPEIKKVIFDSIEKHSKNCTETAEFTSVPELNDTHIYLICAHCMDIQLIL
ncbi:RPA-interacting protein [Papilio machaon]|uniref:RPA-interacting protein n=1 Tax=Papilio machaon TaxID=76193 RepID=A0A194RB05_PAPMA|nr:RPA-interacting protein [Papilio machaon]